MEIIILDGRCMSSREAAHQYLGKSLRFPAYYGNNLDALADCLAELGGQCCVIMTNAAVLREQLGEYGQKLLDVFAEAAEHPGGLNWLVAKE